MQNKLEQVLKISRVFEILALITFITAFVASVVTSTLSVLGFMGNLDKYRESFFPFQNLTSRQIGGVFLAHALTLILLGVLFIFIYLYLKMIRDLKTPFSKTSYLMMRKLAFKALIIGALIDFIPAIIFGEIHLKGLEPLGMISGVVLGLVFLVFSYFIEYGASLAEKEE